LLLRCLDEQYGLASRYVQSTLAESANILGYVRVASDTVINFSDVRILMEEIGAPPLSPEELREFVLHSSEQDVSAVEAESEEASLEHFEPAQPHAGRARAHWHHHLTRSHKSHKQRASLEAEPGVHVANPQRLFRR
jgi:hypothetical protein